MKAQQRSALKEITLKHLIDFKAEEDKELPTMEHYAEHLAREFERYLRAYNDFKEED